MTLAVGGAWPPPRKGRLVAAALHADDVHGTLRQVILNDTAIQAKIVEAMPVLTSLNGFDKVASGGLTGDQVRQPAYHSTGSQKPLNLLW